MNINLIILIVLLFISFRILFFVVYDYGKKEVKKNKIEGSKKIEKKPEKKLEKIEKKPEKKVVKKSEKKLEKKEKYNGQLILFWANWCGLCKKIKPQWNSAKEKVKKLHPNIEVIDINCDTTKNQKCHMLEDNNKVSLDGVPTIVFRRNNNDVEYKRSDIFMGDRSESEIIKFVSVNI